MTELRILYQSPKGVIILIETSKNLTPIQPVPTFNSIDQAK